MNKASWLISLVFGLVDKDEVEMVTHFIRLEEGEVATCHQPSQVTLSSKLHLLLGPHSSQLSNTKLLAPPEL